MRVYNDDIKIVHSGNGVVTEFSYFTYCSFSKPMIKILNSMLGAFGVSWYYGNNKIWFTTEEDLLSFMLRFPHESD